MLQYFGDREPKTNETPHRTIVLSKSILRMSGVEYTAYKKEATFELKGMKNTFTFSTAVDELYTHTHIHKYVFENILLRKNAIH